MNLLKQVFIIYFLFIWSLASAKTFYVSTTGNDSNPGTISQPWKTWGKAFTSTSINPGDIVYFRGGVYSMTNTNGDGYEITRNGTKTDTLCYFAYPGEAPILDCGNVESSGSLNYGITSSGQYVKFKGLTIRNVWQVRPEVECIGWENYGENVVIENCTVYNTSGFGFRTSSANNVHYINCDTYNNCDALRAEMPGNDGYGFAVWDLSSNTNTTYYSGCRAWNCGDDGFVFYSRSYVEVTNCWSFKNGQIEGGERI